MNDYKEPDINRLIGNAEYMGHLNENPNAGVEECLNHGDGFSSYTPKR